MHKDLSPFIRHERDSAEPVEPVVIPVERDKFEIVRQCDLSCCASAAYCERATVPCRWRKWTGGRWECTVIERLSPRERMSFVQLLVSEWLSVRAGDNDSSDSDTAKLIH